MELPSDQTGVWRDDRRESRQQRNGPVPGHRPWLVERPSADEAAAIAGGVGRPSIAHVPGRRRPPAVAVAESEGVGVDRTSVRTPCAKLGARFALVARRRKEWTALVDDVPGANWSPWLPPSRDREEERRAADGFKPRRNGTNRQRQGIPRCAMFRDGQWCDTAAHGILRQDLSLEQAQAYAVGGFAPTTVGRLLVSPPARREADDHVRPH
jgi:hypothetical protein